MKDQVDILLATYNGEEFVSEQIESILDQSHSDFKLIVGDDGSKDSTPEIIRQYAIKFPEKIELHQFSNNVGAISNFSRLAKLSNNNYIMFCDQDDIWLPGKIEMTLNKMKEMESQFGHDLPLLVHTDLSVVDENLKILHPSFWNYSTYLPQNNSISRVLIQNNVTASTIMFNRALQTKAFPIPSKAYMHEHWLNLVATVFGKTGWISEKTIYYRQHSSNSIGAYKRSDMKQDSTLFMDKRSLVNSNRILKAKILQALLFHKRFKNLIDIETKEIIESFINMKNKPFFEEIKTRFRYNFHRGGLYICIYDLIASYLIGPHSKKKATSHKNT